MSEYWTELQVRLIAVHILWLSAILWCVGDYLEKTKVVNGWMEAFEVHRKNKIVTEDFIPPTTEYYVEKP